MRRDISPIGDTQRVRAMSLSGFSNPPSLVSSLHAVRVVWGGEARVPREVEGRHVVADKCLLEFAASDPSVMAFHVLLGSAHEFEEVLVVETRHEV